MNQTYISFDIETTALELESFSESQQEYILRNCQNDEEREKRLFEMALSPMTAKVLVIGMIRMTPKDDGYEEARKALIIDDNSDDGEKKAGELTDGSSCLYMNEKTLLEEFWNVLRANDKAWLISFNGRNFDAPFLMLRSALHKIRPSRNLMSGTKFNYSKHIDLIDELTFFSGSRYGATKRYNFDFYARSFGITSPKGEGIDGSKVGEFYKEGKIDEIALYCMRDVKATWDLFVEWDKYLRF